MKIGLGAARIARFATMIIAAVSLSECGSPAAPTTASVAGVTLGATTIVVGGSGQGTVSLSAAAPADGATIALTSSAPAVASVQTPVMVLAGASTATFLVTGLTTGTATISATLNGSSHQSGTFTVTAAPSALVSIVLSAPTVIGGNPVTGTATISVGAPAGGALVLLAGTDPLTVPPSVTVLAGQLSATFPVTTRTVSSSGSGTVTGSYGGVSVSAMVSVTPSNVATASLGVSGATESDTCSLTNSGTTLNCTFNGSTSTAPGTIVAWDWTYGVTGTLTQTTTGPILTMPAFKCSLLPPPPFPGGSSNFTMIVTLTIHDNLGHVATATDSGVRLLPQGTCGF
jgi:hypothetical protein